MARNDTITIGYFPGATRVYRLEGKVCGNLETKLEMHQCLESDILLVAKAMRCPRSDLAPLGQLRSVPCCAAVSVTRVSVTGHGVSECTNARPKCDGKSNNATIRSGLVACDATGRCPDSAPCKVILLLRTR